MWISNKKPLGTFDPGRRAVRVLAYLSFLFGACQLARAEPFPLEALFNGDVWKEPGFIADFRPAAPGTFLSHRIWPERTKVLGHEPHAILAKFEGGEIVSINILFLDAGTHFGYVSRAQAKAHQEANQAAFRQFFNEVKTTVTNGLQKIASPGNRPARIGRERMLQQNVFLYKCGDLTARLHVIDEQLIKVTWFASFDRAGQWMAPAELEKPLRGRVEDLQKRVEQRPNGDVVITDIPLLPQGDRAYCGLSALAMAMQTLGLEIDTEDYAAAAGVRYGSTRGSRIREVYNEAAKEAGFRLTRTTRFDLMKAKDSIDKGIPVLVWRRWTQERDFLHTAFARRFQQNAALELPKPDADDRDLWPKKDAYSHATVINGYNPKRREIIFTESWSERERNRRMRVEEIEGTAYYAFYIR